MAHHVAQTLTAAVDKIGGDPKQLRSLVDEISRLELDGIAGWRWWWLGTPRIDGFGLQVLVPAKQLGSLANQLAQSQNLQVLNVQSHGIPNPEIFHTTIVVGPPGINSGAGGAHF
jgi:hypothetical protein